MSNEERAAKTKKTTPHSRAWWAREIAACERSGQSMVEYARENDLNLSSMYSWKTALRKTQNRKQEPESAALTFVEVTSPSAIRECTVEIVSPKGWSARFPSHIDNETACRFLALIGAQQ